MPSSPEPSPKPLDSFALLRSKDAEDVYAALASVYARPVLVQLGSEGTFEARFNVCGLSDVDLAYGSLGCAARYEFPPSGFFSQIFPLRGTGEIACGSAVMGISPGCGALVPADYAHAATYSADYEHLVLRISARALTEKLEALTRSAVNAPLRMQPAQDATHPAAQMLQHYLPLFADLLSDPGPPFPVRCVAEAEDVLMTLFLCGHRHNYSHLLEPNAIDAEPLTVRRAEEYIEANAQQAVTLESVASALDISAFSLFRAFRKYRGYSPQEYLARVRAVQPRP